MNTSVMGVQKTSRLFNLSLQSHFKADIMNKSIFLAAVAVAVISICSAETPEGKFYAKQEI